MVSRRSTLIGGDKIYRDISRAMAENDVRTSECLRLSFPSNHVLSRESQCNQKVLSNVGEQVATVDVLFSCRKEMEKLDKILKEKMTDRLKIIDEWISNHGYSKKIQTHNYVTRPLPYQNGSLANIELPLCWIRTRTSLTQFWLSSTFCFNKEEVELLEPEITDFERQLERLDIITQRICEKAAHLEIPSRDRVKGVIFDLDGTLVRLKIDYDRLKRRLHEETGLSEQVHLTEMMELFSDEKRDRLMAIWTSEELEAISSMTNNDKGMQLYETFSDRPRALVTLHSKRTVERVKEKTGLTFNFTISREDSLNRYHQIVIALNRLGIPPRNTLVIGDRLTDAIAARKAGCFFHSVKS